jgi:hypothetical protein
MEEFEVQDAPDQWRLFIDSSKLSLKAVLLHNRNKLSSIPLVHTVHMTETYTIIQCLLQNICYEDHQWNIYADLKVVALLTGLQGGDTKCCCFQCVGKPCEKQALPCPAMVTTRRNGSK